VLSGAAITELAALSVLGEGDMLALFAVAGAFVVVGRVISHSIVHAARRRGIAHHRTLIVGAGVVGTGIGTLLSEAHRYGLEPVAYYDPHPLAVEGGDDSGIELIIEGSVADAIARTRADVVIVAFMSVHEGSLVSVIRQCDRMHTEFMCVPRLFELMTDEGVQMDRVGSIPLLRLRRNTHRSGTWGTKRMVDIVASVTALVVLSPVLALTALGVLVFMGRPILFRQRRLGKDQKPFDILKFRTLPAVPGHESDGVWRDADRQPNWFGALLRSTSIDELPQLVNILRGDMSVVGPRPERPVFADRFSDDFPGYVDRHRVPAGLTGLAQVEGLRGDTSIPHRAAFDNAYVESWTLWNDFKIILRTVGTVFRGGGS
jgi:exopolysaccharide biosynthesis polyprenyl glycosylphosphotransferase